MPSSPDFSHTEVSTSQFFQDGSPIAVDFARLGCPRPAAVGNDLYRTFALLACSEFSFKYLLPLISRCINAGLSDRQLKAALMMFLGGNDNDYSSIDASQLDALKQGIKILRRKIDEIFEANNDTEASRKLSLETALIEFLKIIAPAVPVSSMYEDDFENFLKQNLDDDTLDDSSTEAEFQDLTLKLLESYGFSTTAINSADKADLDYAYWSATHVPDEIKDIVYWQSYNDDESARDAVFSLKAAAKVTLQQIALQRAKEDYLRLREGTKNTNEFIHKILKDSGVEFIENNLIIWHREAPHSSLINLAECFCKIINNQPEDKEYSKQLDQADIAMFVSFALQIERLTQNISSELKLIKKSKKSSQHSTDISNAANKNMFELINQTNDCISRGGKGTASLLSSFQSAVSSYYYVDSDLKDIFVDQLVRLRMLHKQKDSWFWPKGSSLAKFLKDFATIELSLAVSRSDSRPEFTHSMARYIAAILGTDFYIFNEQVKALKINNIPFLAVILSEMQFADTFDRAQFDTNQRSALSVAAIRQQLSSKLTASEMLP